MTFVRSRICEADYSARRWWIRLVVAFAVIGTTDCTRDSLVQAPTALNSEWVAPLFVSPDTVRLVPNQYMVIFKDHVTDVRGLADGLARANGASILTLWETGLRGFVINLPSKAVDALRVNPDVAYVEQDMFTGPDTIQQGAPWSLDRIDQFANPLTTSYSYDFTGAGVNIYIIDTGIRSTHVDFRELDVSRATVEFEVQSFSFPGTDCHGHGTGVASVAGGRSFGVAKRATLRGIRIAGCSGGTLSSWMVTAINYVQSNHIKPAVANISYEMPSQSEKNAVQQAVNAGVIVVLAAGNHSTNACTDKPATGVPDVLVAAALDSTSPQDRRASFSNFGACVDVFAPGVGIPMAWAGSDNDQQAFNGTSFSAPLTTGVAALYLQRFPNDPPSTVSQVVAGSAIDVGVADAQWWTSFVLYSFVPYPSVRIEGLFILRPDPEDQCRWDAIIRGARPPVQYQWSGFLTGTYSNIFGGGVAPGADLVVEIWDAAGTYARDNRWITVDPNAPDACPE